MRKRLSSLTIRAILSALFIFLLIYKLDIENLLLAFNSISIKSLILPSIFYLFTYLLISLRWLVLLRAFKPGISFRAALGYQLIGFFFSNFLPSGIGGDFVRAYLVSKRYGKADEITSTIIMERLLGFAATLIISLVLSPFSVMRKELRIFILILNIIFTGIIIIALNLRPKKIFSFLPFVSVRDFLSSTINSIYSFREKLRELFWGFFFSLLYQTALIYFYYIVGRALGVNISLVDYLTYLPLIWVISLLPVSINAIGVREAGFSFFFRELGQSPSLGFMNSIVGFFITLILSLIGGVVFILNKGGKIASIEA
ncbi:MAG: lysylphosphatidylglycerol synthase transmembrane domain-containing protein [bacterium]